MTYNFNGMLIPDDQLQVCRDYVEHGLEPGHFISAIICNNLTEAVKRADRANLPIIAAYVSWFYNEAPSRCWGSPEKMIEWMAARAVERLDRKAAP